MDIKGLLTQAVEKKASDIVFSVGSPPKLRIGDQLVDFGTDRLVPDIAKKMILSLLSDEQREKFEENRCIDFSTYLKGIGRFRITAYYQRGVVGAVFRVVMADIPMPEEIGIPKNIVDLCTLSQGLVLITGPSGSGKSTTIASLVEHVNQNRGAHIVTIEDPIEYTFRPEKSVIDQIEIGKDVPNQVTALRNVLHQNPEVVVISEISDMETILSVLKIAASGHLVFSTMTTQNATNTLNTLIEIFPEYQQQQVRVSLANSLKAIVSQQLFVSENKFGRVAAREILIVNEVIANLIVENKIYMIPNAIKSDKKSGMIALEDSIKTLYSSGSVSRETIATTGAAEEVERAADDTLRVLEKQLYDKNIDVRKRAELQLKRMEAEGNKAASTILSEFMSVYETNFDENKIGIKR